MSQPETLPLLLRDEKGPVFREPWQAEAYAMAVSLRQRGVFTAAEWAQALGDEIERARRQGDPDRGDTYYNHWLAALERLVAQKGIAAPETLARYARAWDRAADRTPHGKPIELRQEDFS